MEETQNSKQWNDFLLSQQTQAGIFLQSWEWGEFQKSVGRKVYRYQLDNHRAQAIELPLPLEKKYWFIPRGISIGNLEKEARKQGVLFLRFEPITEISRKYDNSREISPIHPKETLIFDLSKSEDELLSGMREKTRYNVRLAGRKGVKCRTIGVNEFNKFWGLMEETAKRDKFRAHPREYYEKMLGAFKDGSMKMELRVAVFNEILVASALVVYFGDTATYLHGASSYEHRALMGPYALHWDIIKNAKKEGYRYYDFWGIDEKKWPGITRFKMGFGGKVVNYPGTFDLPLSKFWYTVYRLGRKII